jgi:hypothetical protein
VKLFMQFNGDKCTPDFNDLIQSHKWFSSAVSKK